MDSMLFYVKHSLCEDRTVILKCLKDPKGYGTNKQKKNHLCRSQRIWAGVCHDTVWSSTQIKATTGADCSSIKRCLQSKGFRNKKKLFRGLNLAPLDFARKHQTRDIQMWKKVLFSDQLYLTLTVLAWQGDAIWDVLYATQWSGHHHDLGCSFLQWNNVQGCQTAAGYVKMLQQTSLMTQRAKAAVPNAHLTKENNVTLLDDPASLLHLTESNWEHLEMERQEKFTKMDISSSQWMPFVKPSSPLHNLPTS